MASDTVPEKADELIGRTIGSYRVERQLGKGGMGAVYLALHPVIGSKVAIKFLHPQYKSDAKIVDRFYNEARVVNVIGHDNILKILDLAETPDGQPYFVMEYLHGKSLQDLLHGAPSVPLEVVGPILLQVCEALEAAHRKGIVHRDLKPDNVYLISLKGKKNFVKVVDFGIARVTGDDGVSTGNTVTGMVMGTPAYMSPEQGSGATSQIDGRSDVYSLGIMMYQLATGELPFKGKNFGEILVGHLQLNPRPPRELNPGVPPLYEQIILQCLAKKQEDRFQSMHELEIALADCLDELGIDKGLPADDGRQEEPGDTVPEQRTPARISKPPIRRSNPGSKPRISQPPTQMHVPSKGRGKLVGGILGGALAAAAAVSFVLWQNANERAEQKARDEVRSARVAAAQLAAKQDDEPVALSLAVEPEGAEAVATWPRGEQRGTSPLTLKVPRNAKVHVELSKAGYLGHSMDVIADQPQTVRATLEKQQAQIAAEPPPVQEQTHRKPPQRTREHRPARDGLIDLDESK